MDERERLAFLGWASTPKFKSKVDKAIAVIREALDIAPAYVACSWGKDSVVMLHLCQQVMTDIPVMFAEGFFMDSYDNFSEVQRQYCDRFSTNLTTIGQTESESLLPRKEPAPKTAARIYQEQSGYQLVFMGLRTEESKNRSRSIKKYGLIHQYKSGCYRACPLGFWQTKDIWGYIVLHNLPYLNSYDRRDKFGTDSRTTAHVIPTPAQSSLGAEVRARLAFEAPEFAQLLRKYHDVN